MCAHKHPFHNDNVYIIAFCLFPLCTISPIWLYFRGCMWACVHDWELNIKLNLRAATFMMDSCVGLYYYAEVRLWRTLEKKERVSKWSWRYKRCIHKKFIFSCLKLYVLLKSIVFWHKFILDLIRSFNESICMHTPINTHTLDWPSAVLNVNLHLDWHS